MPSRTPPWRPRGSALGYYAACSYRAAFDRALYEHVFTLPPEVAAAIEAKKQSSPYADLGTVIHWHAQVALGAIFARGADAHKYTPEQLANAAALFKGDTVAAMKAVNAAAQLLVAAIGPAPSGGRWEAEVVVKRRWVTGHIDLLDRRGGVVLDIKTTSRPPHYARLPPTHLIQTMAYARGCMEMGIPINKVRVVYVDAQAAQWFLPAEYDPMSDGMVEYGDMIVALARRLQKSAYLSNAAPNVGHACEEWCPYTMLCRDRYSADKGDMVRADVPKITGVNPFGAAG